MSGGLEAIKPAGFAWAVVPSDSVDLVKRTRAIIVGVAGNVACEMFDPATGRLATVVVPVAAGVPIAIETKKIFSTNTTATTIVALA